MVKRKIDVTNHKKAKVILTMSISIVLMVVVIVLWAVTKNSTNSADISPVAEQVQAPISSDLAPITPKVAKKPEVSFFDSEKLQETLNSWATGLHGNAGVVITNDSGAVLASLNPDESFSTASIYKLFVAYEGYLQLDRQENQGSEAYINGHTRLECLDLMIRESDSPCAEKLWRELGKQETTDKLITYGITNTSLVSLTTTADDVAKILLKISNGEGLSNTSQLALLDSMKNQIFRFILNKGFSSNVTVYNKVGFSEYQEYHDAAILEFPNKQRLIMSVLTQNVGTSAIADLGSRIEATVLGEE